MLNDRYLLCQKNSYVNISFIGNVPSIGTDILMARCVQFADKEYTDKHNPPPPYSVHVYF